MQTILLFGAGKSATVLIDYLINQSIQNNWHVVIADTDLDLILSKTKNNVVTQAVKIDITNDEQRNNLIKNASIVISMMPPALHFLIAKDCVIYNKNLLTASYIDENIKSLEKEILNKKLLFLCEMGLDPGIDHMSAMKLIDTINKKGGLITSFQSHCGGLIAPESDNNPWHYKISWNPKNIVLAGNGGAIYKKDNKIVNTDYSNVFENSNIINFPNFGNLAWYANRNSLPYIPIYKLENTHTFLRTTLRHPSFNRGWDFIVNLGLTDTTDYDNIIDCVSYADWLSRKLFLVEDEEMSFTKYLELYVEPIYHKELFEQFDFLELFSKKSLPKKYDSSADILLHIIETKFAMQANDIDMIVMLHQISYTINNKQKNINSSLLVKGTDNLRTAMAKTVGLPLGIAAKLILQETINVKGLHIPTQKQIYLPVLQELETLGISFLETED